MTSVSIVTPSYNQAEFITDTLESVKNQTHDDVEHIVVDGGSDDGTLDILREYTNSYDLSWISEHDNGQSDAINKGFEQATGDIVAWLNSDDVYFDIYVLARVVEYFESHDADVLYGDLAYIDERSTVSAIDVRPDFDAAKLPYRILIGQPATFFRQDVVKNEKVRVDLQYSMDYEYWLRLSQTYEFRHVTDVFAGFREYEAQKSMNREAMAAELREVFAAYSYPERSSVQTLLENAKIEVTRFCRAGITTCQLARKPPVLAFDGEFAPLPRMLANIGPSTGDAVKVWRRLQSSGETG